jgi:chitinase
VSTDVVKRNAKRNLILAALFIMESSSISAQQLRVVGYYPMWGRTTLPATAVKYAYLTHINHAFAWPNADGSIAFSDPVVDTALINSTHRAGRKILLSFGGAGATQTTNFALVAGDSVLRRRFVTNVVSDLSTYHYDGVDLDWEGPSSRADKANEVTLVQQLREAFQLINTPLLITMAIGPSNWSGQWRDFGALSPFVDWFNAMEYDYHGSWSKVAGHNAPLYAGSDPTSDPDYYSIDQSLQYLTETRAIPKGKLTLGLPFYGKSFGTSTLYTSYSGEQDLAYRDVIGAVQSGGWTYAWDTGSGVPYYTSATSHTLISFDDSTSLAMKCQYTIDHGLSGVMIWELSQDVIGQKQPLLDVIAARIMTVTGIAQTHSRPSPTDYTLFDCYPNPFNPATVIRYYLGRNGFVSLKVFDLFGREITTLVQGDEQAGTRTVRFDAARYNLSSGVYFYRLESRDFMETRKFVLMK